MDEHEEHTPEEVDRDPPARSGEAGIVRRRPRPEPDAAAQPAVQIALALLVIFLFLLVLFVVWPFLSGG